MNEPRLMNGSINPPSCTFDANMYTKEHRTPSFDRLGHGGFFLFALFLKVLHLTFDPNFGKQRQIPKIL